MLCWAFAELTFQYVRARKAKTRQCTIHEVQRDPSIVEPSRLRRRRRSVMRNEKHHPVNKGIERSDFVRRRQREIERCADSRIRERVEQVPC